MTYWVRVGTPVIDCASPYPMNFPADLRYTEDHEWAKVEGNRARVGITDYAQDALGDVVYVQLPAMGTQVETKGPLGEVESTKSVSDIYAPLAGRVVEVNASLDDHPELINSDPYGEGWICVIEFDDLEHADGLMDASAYERLVSAE